MRQERIRVFEEGFGAIKDSLNKLMRASDAKAVLIIDRDGRLITAQGDVAKIDLSAFATLSAADFAATAQLASLIGEPEFTTLYHQGVKEHLYFSTIAEGLILAVLFDQRTTLGLVRVRVKNTANELARIMVNIFKKSDEKPVGFGDDFTREAENEIDKLFR
jgi:predicted regulator of Ras-like GTPase activity (Roadblock/LC7/MglB family)